MIYFKKGKNMVDDYELFMDSFVELVSKTITNVSILKTFENIKFDDIISSQEIKSPSNKIFKIKVIKK